MPKKVSNWYTNEVIMFVIVLLNVSLIIQHEKGEGWFIVFSVGTINILLTLKLYLSKHTRS
jgi:hypothetical protein